MPISTTHKLLTTCWTAEVEGLRTAIEHFKVPPAMSHDCVVAFFEIAGDPLLHVNVTHPYATRTIPGWAGPGRVFDGFVHNRRFGHVPRRQILRHIRAVVFASAA